MPDMPPSLRDDVDWLRKEAGHVDVENNFDDDGSLAGDGLRGIANRIEHLLATVNALLPFLEGIVKENGANDHVWCVYNATKHLEALAKYRSRDA